MIKLTPPKEISRVMQLAVLVAPSKGKRKHVYIGSHCLKCRNINIGRYKFSRPDDKPMGHLITVQVQISEPWCDEKVWSLSSLCRTHGIQCYCASEDCDVEMVPTQVSKWLALVSMKNGYFEIGLFKTASSKKKPPNYAPACCAGFAVIALLKED